MEGLPAPHDSQWHGAKDMIGLQLSLGLPIPHFSHWLRWPIAVRVFNQKEDWPQPQGPHLCLANSVTGSRGSVRPYCSTYQAQKKP